VEREGVEPDESCEDGEGNREPVSLRRVEPHGGRAHQRQRGDDVPVEHDGRQPSLVRERRVVSSITAARRGIGACVLLLGSTLITIGINVASLAPPDVERREAGHECSPLLRSRLTNKEGQHPLLPHDGALCSQIIKKHIFFDLNTKYKTNAYQW
jgi:hypothetical protein